ncbi:unnamed protein product [Haemonchus placei]|uniref:Uncharacterized protein n=1 Tax=Haemonchus placei TaxID=6290 RepID=A0A0N4WE10_HAEPC|nr:unnamed protein product [Haemonchus placei]
MIHCLSTIRLRHRQVVQIDHLLLSGFPENDN